MGVGLEDIKKLRTMTGAGLGDCKKALAEANGDIEAAIEIIRILDGMGNRYDA